MREFERFTTGIERQADIITHVMREKTEDLFIVIQQCEYTNGGENKNTNGGEKKKQ